MLSASQISSLRTTFAAEMTVACTIKRPSSTVSDSGEPTGSAPSTVETTTWIYTSSSRPSAIGEVPGGVVPNGAVLGVWPYGTDVQSGDIVESGTDLFEVIEILPRATQLYVTGIVKSL
jgi:hypothetical protein